MPENKLYYGDNPGRFASLRQRRIDFDIVYLDPPFKSQQDYNVLFAEKDGTRTRYGCEFKTQTIQNILERDTE